MKKVQTWNDFIAQLPCGVKIPKAALGRQTESDVNRSEIFVHHGGHWQINVHLPDRTVVTVDYHDQLAGFKPIDLGTSELNESLSVILNDPTGFARQGAMGCNNGYSNLLKVSIPTIPEEFQTTPFDQFRFTPKSTDLYVKQVEQLDTGAVFLEFDVKVVSKDDSDNELAHTEHYQALVAKTSDANLLRCHNFCLPTTYNLPNNVVRGVEQWYSEMQKSKYEYPLLIESYFDKVPLTLDPSIDKDGLSALRTIFKLYQDGKASLTIPALLLALRECDIEHLPGFLKEDSASFNRHMNAVCGDSLARPEECDAQVLFHLKKLAQWVPADKLVRLPVFGKLSQEYQNDFLASLTAANMARVWQNQDARSCCQYFTNESEQLIDTFVQSHVPQDQREPYRLKFASCLPDDLLRVFVAPCADFESWLKTPDVAQTINALPKDSFVEFFINLSLDRRKIYVRLLNKERIIELIKRRDFPHGIKWLLLSDVPRKVFESVVTLTIDDIKRNSRHLQCALSMLRDEYRDILLQTLSEKIDAKTFAEVFSKIIDSLDLDILRAVMSHKIMDNDEWCVALLAACDAGSLATLLRLDKVVNRLAKPEVLAGLLNGCDADFWAVADLSKIIEKVIRVLRDEGDSMKFFKALNQCTLQRTLLRLVERPDADRLMQEMDRERLLECLNDQDSGKVAYAAFYLAAMKKDSFDQLIQNADVQEALVKHMSHGGGLFLVLAPADKVAKLFDAEFAQVSTREFTLDRQITKEDRPVVFKPDGLIEQMKLDLHRRRPVIRVDGDALTKVMDSSGKLVSFGMPSDTPPNDIMTAFINGFAEIGQDKLAPSVEELMTEAQFIQAPVEISQMLCKQAGAKSVSQEATGYHDKGIIHDLQFATVGSQLIVTRIMQHQWSTKWGYDKSVQDEAFLIRDKMTLEYKKVSQGYQFTVKKKTYDFMGSERVKKALQWAGCFAFDEALPDDWLPVLKAALPAECHCTIEALGEACSKDFCSPSTGIKQCMWQSIKEFSLSDKTANGAIFRGFNEAKKISWLTEGPDGSGSIPKKVDSDDVDYATYYQYLTQEADSVVRTWLTNATPTACVKLRYGLTDAQRGALNAALGVPLPWLNITDDHDGFLEWLPTLGDKHYREAFQAILDIWDDISIDVKTVCLSNPESLKLLTSRVNVGKDKYPVSLAADMVGFDRAEVRVWFNGLSDQVRREVFHKVSDSGAKIDSQQKMNCLKNASFIEFLADLVADSRYRDKAFKAIQSFWNIELRETFLVSPEFKELLSQRLITGAELTSGSLAADMVGFDRAEVRVWFNGLSDQVRRQVFDKVLKSWKDIDIQQKQDCLCQPMFREFLSQRLISGGKLPDGFVLDLVSLDVTALQQILPGHPGLMIAIFSDLEAMKVASEEVLELLFRLDAQVHAADSIDPKTLAKQFMKRGQALQQFIQRTDRKLFDPKKHGPKTSAKAFQHYLRMFAQSRTKPFKTMFVGQRRIASEKMFNRTREYLCQGLVEHSAVTDVSKMADLLLLVNETIDVIQRLLSFKDESGDVLSLPITDLDQELHRLVQERVQSIIQRRDVDDHHTSVNDPARTSLMSRLLLWAAEKGYGRLCRVLVFLGADKNAQNSRGQCVYDVAKPEIQAWLGVGCQKTAVNNAKPDVLKAQSIEKALQNDIELAAALRQQDASDDVVKDRVRKLLEDNGYADVIDSDVDELVRKMIDPSRPLSLERELVDVGELNALSIRILTPEQLAQLFKNGHAVGDQAWSDLTRVMNFECVLRHASPDYLERFVKAYSADEFVTDICAVLHSHMHDAHMGAKLCERRGQSNSDEQVAGIFRRHLVRMAFNRTRACVDKSFWKNMFEAVDNDGALFAEAVRVHVSLLHSRRVTFDRDAAATDEDSSLSNQLQDLLQQLVNDDLKIKVIRAIAPMLSGEGSKQLGDRLVCLDMLCKDFGELCTDDDLIDRRTGLLRLYLKDDPLGRQRRIANKNSAVDTLLKGEPDFNELCKTDFKHIFRQILDSAREGADEKMNRHMDEFVSYKARFSDIFEGEVLTDPEQKNLQYLINHLAFRSCLIMSSWDPDIERNASLQHRVKSLVMLYRELNDEKDTQNLLRSIAKRESMNGALAFCVEDEDLLRIFMSGEEELGDQETRSWTVSFLRSQKGPDDCEEEFINRVRSDKEFLDELMKHVRRDAMQKGQDGIKPWLDKFAYLNHFDLIAKCIEYLGAEPGTDTDKMDNLDQALRAVYDNYGAQLEPGSVKNIFSALLCNAKEKVKKDRAPIQSAEVGQRTVDVSVGQPQAQNACDQLIDSEMFDNLLNTESVWEAVCKDSSLIQDILDNDVGLKKVWEHPRALKSVFNDTSSMAAVFKNPQASARVAKDEDMVAAIKDKPELIDHLVEAEPNNPLRQQIAQELIDEGFESGGEDAVDDQVHGGNDQIRYDAWDKDQTCAKANRFFKPDQYEEKKRASTTKIIDTLKEAQPWFRFLSERNQVIFACQTALLVAQAGSDDLPSVTPQSVM